MNGTRTRTAPGDSLNIDVDFLFGEARAWTGAKEPGEGEPYERRCEAARDNLKRLIAAQVALLKACQAALDLTYEALRSDIDSEAYDKLTDAIARAEGGAA